MATVRDIIRRSMLLIGAIAVGETPTDEEAQDGLQTLNDMLEKRQVRKSGFRTEATRKVLNTPPAQPDPAKDGLDPRKLMHRLSEVVPDNAIVMTGPGGHYWGFTVMHLALPETVDFIEPYQFGAIGQAMASVTTANQARGAA